jgi:hypothetical protein
MVHDVQKVEGNIFVVVVIPKDHRSWPQIIPVVEIIPEEFRWNHTRKRILECIKLGLDIRADIDLHDEDLQFLMPVHEVCFSTPPDHVSGGL